MTWWNSNRLNLNLDSILSFVNMSKQARASCESFGPRQTINLASNHIYLNQWPAQTVVPTGHLSVFLSFFRWYNTLQLLPYCLFPKWETCSDWACSCCGCSGYHKSWDQRFVSRAFCFSEKLKPYAATNGIVIATEKKTSSILIDDYVIEKVAVICPNIGIVYSGMGPDFRILVTKARKSAQSYWKIYGEYPPTKVLTQEIATVMQQATQSG